MKLKIVSILSAGFLFFIAFQSCKKENGSNTTNISAYGGSRSHNTGKNCMSCHASGGEGKGWFNVAGSVYDSTDASVIPNATVRLFTGPKGSGTLKYTVQVDGKGNFYTTDPIDFTQGLYPSVQGATTTKYMSSTLVNGQCNNCHGVSTGKIWTK